MRRAGDRVDPVHRYGGDRRTQDVGPNNGHGVTVRLNGCHGVGVGGRPARRDPRIAVAAPVALGRTTRRRHRSPPRRGRCAIPARRPTGSHAPPGPAAAADRSAPPSSRTWSLVHEAAASVEALTSVGAERWAETCTGDRTGRDPAEHGPASDRPWLDRALHQPRVTNALMRRGSCGLAPELPAPGTAPGGSSTNRGRGQGIERLPVVWRPARAS